MISFKLNRKIEIYSEDELKMGDSTVQDEDEKSIYISCPIGNNGHMKLVPGEIIRAMYCGEDNKVYGFMTEAATIISDDNIPLIKVNKPSEYEIIPRREFVRIPIMLDIQIFVIDEKISIAHKTPDELKEIYKYKKWIKGYTYDFSAGGLGAVVEESVDYGKEILCLVGDECFHKGFIGKVVRTSRNKAGKKLYKMGVQFVGLDYQCREKLVKYTFQKMREQLKVRSS
ncbi:flagellar brake protein [Anaeromicrobium sediminis]|uniref:PilZ domain-containing protein n=1 Tax=Anaeromicrobium sediminis TaxID=1478221 RepID=A0A267M9U7_9FIRM|nr:flagellar brake domain-containing protein [Anaeromicrobium sediminis]PAB56217.1 hypothetical protein CCE28_21175 [Anaeromicrobium sediminis]